MKSKLVGVCVTLLASATWWLGCCDTAANTGAVEPDAVSKQEAGTTMEAGIAPSTEAYVNFESVKDGKCPITPCGGDPIGSFTVTGGCIDNEVFAPVVSLCPTVVVSGIEVKARGTLVTTADTATRNIQLIFGAKLSIPNSCLEPASILCKDVAAQIVSSLRLKSADCTSTDAGTCDCSMTDEKSTITTEAYTASAGKLTTGTGTDETTRTYKYCVAGTKLEYAETTPRTLPATLVFTKK